MPEEWFCLWNNYKCLERYLLPLSRMEKKRATFQIIRRSRFRIRLRIACPRRPRRHLDAPLLEYVH